MLKLRFNWYIRWIIRWKISVIFFHLPIVEETMGRLITRLQFANISWWNKSEPSLISGADLVGGGLSCTPLIKKMRHYYMLTCLIMPEIPFLRISSLKISWRLCPWTPPYTPFPWVPFSKIMYPPHPPQNFSCLKSSILLHTNLYSYLFGEITFSAVNYTDYRAPTKRLHEWAQILV